jgi:hypothetical protein
MRSRSSVGHQQFVGQDAEQGALESVAAESLGEQYIDSVDVDEEVLTGELSVSQDGPPAETALQLCKFFSRGDCWHKDDCWYVHLTEGQVKEKKKLKERLKIFKVQWIL